jgi:murein DD-endopeptidase MepM/ murein hydrolase activator NlpD
MKLSAGGFPESKYDYSFSERVAAMAEGYAPYESRYDANGNCVSGCAYAGMTVESESKRLERDTKAIRQKISIYCSENPDAYGCAAPEPDKKTGATQKIAKAPAAQQRACSPANFSIPASQTIPLGMPLTGSPRITSGFQRARRHPVYGIVRPHTGIDFAAPSGTPVFSPAIGTVEKAFQNSECGKGIIIRHSNGLATGYCHLSNNGILLKGAQVGAGCMIAETGNSGVSTGPHLHYIVYLNGQPVPPENFIR